MRVPLSWLKEFIDITLSANEIAKILTQGGLEVDKIEKKGSDEILEISPAPNKILTPSGLEEEKAAKKMIEEILEISLTPNLGHCMSILGIARELSALMRLPLKLPSYQVKENGKDKIQDKIAISIDDKEQCYRYACRLITNVRVGPSPKWLQTRLEECGIRSINNIVDVTNYVLLEMGQPLHAFDYNKISHKKIHVTSKTSFTSLEALDDKTYPISQGMLLITDGEKPVAFAGVIGGKESSISETTQDLLLESAYFTPQATRRTSKLLGVRTDASHRFEKEVDLEMVVAALDRAAALIQELTHGTVAKGVLDERSRLMPRSPITCRIERVNLILGTRLSVREMAEIFLRLEIKIEREDEKALHVTPPSYRNDLKKEIDLIEEVGRVFGYTNIPLKTPKHTTSSLGDSPLFLFEREMRQRLIAEGLQECITCDLISPTLAEATKENPDPSSWISVLHPASIDQSILRTSLLPGLLQTVKLNHSHQNKEIAAFEVGKIHFKEGEAFKEQSACALICSGHSVPTHYDPKPREVDFYDLKGKVENLLLGLGISHAKFEVSHLHNFHPGRQARIKVDEIYVGALGELHPGRLQLLGIDSRVYFAQLNLHDLLPLKRQKVEVEELALFPGSERDWTITVKEELPIDALLQLVRAYAPPLLEKVELIDIYRGPQVGEEKKNITLRLFYRDKTKTLSFEDTTAQHKKITEEVARKLA
ncbi:MAG: phenylalanine--tRNA ligase subunit beta [Chlamydiales bacterium]